MSYIMMAVSSVPSEGLHLIAHYRNEEGRIRDELYTMS